MASIKDIEALLDEKLRPITALTEAVKEAVKKIEDLELENNFLKKQLQSLVLDMDSLENQDRRMNLIVHGVKENEPETWEMTENRVINEFQAVGVNIDGTKVQRAHRIHSRTFPRPIVIKFTEYKMREQAMKNGRAAFRNNGSMVRVTEDLTRRARAQRAILRPIQEESYESGYKTFFKRGDLVVGDVLFQADTIYKSIKALTREGEREVKTKAEAMAILRKKIKRLATSPPERPVGQGKTFFRGRDAGTSNAMGE